MEEDGGRGRIKARAVRECVLYRTTLLPEAETRYILVAAVKVTGLEIITHESRVTLTTGTARYQGTPLPLGEG